MCLRATAVAGSDCFKQHVDHKVYSGIFVLDLKMLRGSEGKKSDVYHVGTFKLWQCSCILYKASATFFKLGVICNGVCDFLTKFNAFVTSNSIIKIASKCRFSL